MRILVLNGVNLDVIGRRDPELYGGLALSELETRIYEWASALQVTVRARQTNSEGELIEWCHEAYDWADGVIINPGAWGHYSWAIRDAIELFDGPGRRGAPLGHPDEREEWRRFSVLEGVVEARVSARGPTGYREALEFLVKGRK